MATHLSTDVEAALLRAVQATWHDLNGTLFRRALSPPTFELLDTRARLGEWRRAVRVLALSRPLVVEQPWGVTVEVLKHEMAHQFVDEVLGAAHEGPHGPTFKSLCERLGIDGRAAGQPSPGESAPGGETARLVARIAKLLALAESSNEHEANLAMGEAQRLMLKHNIAAPRKGDAAETGYGFRHLGRPTGRVQEHERVLARILEEHFFVEAIRVPVWRPLEARRGSVLEVCGTPENLEMASYVHDFLTRTAERLWEEYRRSRGLDGNADRRVYLAGVMEGFLEKLKAGKKEARREGLVWVGDPALHQFLRKRHPYIRTTRHVTRAGEAAHSDGRAAGRTIELNRPVGGAATSRGRFLPPART